MVDDMVADYSTSASDRRISLNEIVTYVSECYTCAFRDLVGPKRSKDIAWPRQVAIYLARELTDHSLADIGNFFGGRDHSTILYSYNKVSDMVAEDEKMLGKMNEHKAAIRDQ